MTELSPIAGFTDLYSLDAGKTAIKDISALSELKDMGMLILDGTEVTDLSPLSGMSMLRELDISRTPVTDISPLYSLASAPGVSAYETALDEDDAQKYFDETGGYLDVKH